MRWVNHHSHPGDNRYRVFVFREQDHAERFAERLSTLGVGYERHEEDGEVMFGVAKIHDRVTIRGTTWCTVNSATHSFPTGDGDGVCWCSQLRCWRWQFWAG